MADTDKVLLVDDEAEYAETWAQRLRANGLDVEIAIGGEQCLEKAGHTAFRTVILDLASSGMNGLDTFKALRADDPDIQVVFVSGRATIKTAVEAIRLGAVDVLEKPIDFGTLLAKIREAQARHPAANEP